MPVCILGAVCYAFCMSKSLVSLFLITLVFASGYFWYTASAICPIPIEYRLGVVNDEFGLSDEAALAAITEAESLWEDATGLNLFSYQTDARIAINFVYDERQQLTKAEETFSANLREAKEVNEVVRSEYQKLVAEYETIRTSYETKRTAYERDLRAYNNEVSTWNDKGGAPQEVFESLNAEKERLDAEQKAIDQLRRSMNDLIAEINTLSDEANSLVDRYNQGVERYNETFTEGAEFTQGDYQGKSINIYQFTDREELVLVLAHEFGHALGIGHVENPESIMHLRMGGQSTIIGVTEEDIAGFAAVCGDGSVWSKLGQLRFW